VRKMPKALVALGGNLPSDVGHPQITLTKALILMAQSGLRVAAISRFYESACFPAGAGPDYVNAAVVIETDLSPRALLAALHRIEADFGRLREGRWGARSLDLDLIAYGDTVLPDADTQAQWRQLALADQMRATPDHLILPHPRVQDRAFVLLPLNDVAPDWCHPLTGRSVTQMLDNLPDGALTDLVAL
jgi:2-amino-4-hydroxy-6-hydroxymethyldihydropteridine diphosphokinase